MDFIDLEDDQPQAEGVYIVTIERTSGNSRTAEAFWVMNEGFTLCDTELQDEEYIVSWQP